MKTTITAAALLWLIPICAALGGEPNCSQFTPWGQPVLAGEHHVTVLCRTAYVSAHDDDRLVPDWVAWMVTPEHAIGCLNRTNNFAADPDLPAGHRAKPSDYDKSGYDQGHFAPAQDFSYSPQTETESFYMSNMSPQLPALNRFGWEQVEAQTREWARSGLYGALYVMDGPIFGPTPKTVGSDRVAIPDAYWKVILSPSTWKALAFIMPNAPVSKDQADGEVVAISDIERKAGISIPTPPNIDKLHAAIAWPADLSAYMRAKKAACAH